MHVLHHAAHRRVAQHVGVHLALHVVRRAQRVGASSLERGRRDEEVRVVRDVADVVHHVARDGVASLVRRIRLDRVLVGRRRVVEAAGAQVDVRRHVHEMSGAWHERRQPVGVLLRALRIRRRFDGVDVEMDRARMVGLPLQH